MTKSASLPKVAQPEQFVKFTEDERKQSIVDRFEKQVDLYPDNLAVKKGDFSYTYSELNRNVNQLAHQIHEMTDGRNTPIAFLIGHGVSQIVALLGIIKSGNAYVALDPAFPVERLAFMISDSETPILITDNANLDLALGLSDPPLRILNLDEIESETPTQNPGNEFTPDSVATLQYTSGSTGQPKGCMIPHKLLMHHVMSLTNRRFINPADRFVLLFSTSYAGSMGTVFGTLLNGAGLYIYDLQQSGFADLSEFLSRERITIYGSVPSTFRYFATTLKGNNLFPDLRLVFLGGEAVLKKDLELFQKHFAENCFLENSLAGTEYCVIRSNFISMNSEVEGGLIPVGYEVEGKEILLLDEGGAEVPVGEVGEINLRSKYVSLGYWRRAELTKEKYYPVPGDDDVVRIPTGDLGRMDTDGCLYHLGRKDNQVKIRGHRVELAEITSSLLDSSLIEDAYVKAHSDTAGENQLVAYLVPKTQSDSLVEAVVSELGERLPGYMIPTEFVVLDEIPKTPSGKVDTLSLPEPVRNRSSLRTEYVKPQNAIEQTLVEIWEKLLQFQPIGITDDFFELGGHSLLALRLIAEIEDKLEVKVPFSALVQVRTIHEIATLLLDESGLKSWSQLVALQPLGLKPPLFLIPPSAVTVMIFKDLAKYMSEDRPVYALEYSGMDPETKPHDSIPEMARDNLEKIRAIQPGGPYYLGGMCFGGLVAYEMAKQLVASGEQVPFLGILDSTHAPYLSKPRAYNMFMITRFINQKILRKKFPIGMAPLEQAMQKFAPEDEFSHRVYDVFTTHNYARVKYITTPYPGPITLFNTAGSRGDFSKGQWKAVAGGGLETVTIPGQHANPREGISEGEVSFIHEPSVQVLAQCMNKNIEKLDH